MLDYKRFKKDIFSIDKDSFEPNCLEVFEYQYVHNKLYRVYCQYLGKSPDNVSLLKEIPFLPIDLFKNHEITSESWIPEKIFQSSGTTRQIRSRHLVRDESFYHSIAKSHFEALYGPLSSIQLFALLPSYQQQKNSSLINMVDHFMTHTLSDSNYCLSNPRELKKTISNSSAKKILIGVSFALLDLADNTFIEANNLTIIETGGMKGRRKEIIREELHSLIKKGIGDHAVHSEYGMTELTSQAYLQQDHFIFPSWADVLIRDVNDPLHYQMAENTGGINVIDLANVATCSFIETMDLGRKTQEQGFQVLGRFDNSDIRGCNLLL